ncbi:MAG: hypothetical protein OHK006_13650 [Thermodesulfovibrionales bacterium]
MRTTAYIMIGILLLALLGGTASAITITPSPSPANTGQNVQLTVTGRFVGSPASCSYNVNYGDGATQFGIPAAACADPDADGTWDCLNTLNHVYANPGSYTILVYGMACPSSAPSDPNNPGITLLQVVAPPSAAVTVTPVPSTLNVAWGVPAGRNITYRFTGGGNVTLQSTGGRFIANGREIGRVNVPLTAVVVNGQANVPEFLNIPVDLIAKAVKMKVTQFEYRRSFTGPPASGAFRAAPPPASIEAVVRIFVTSEAVGDFNINRMELYFENRRPEITVERNTQKLKAFVDLRFTGSGLLEGYWEVDGRILSQVVQHLTYGRSVTLQIPEIPGLPTFDEGTHAVRFIITRPATDMQFPTIIYYVTARTVKLGPPVRLTSPAEGFGAGPGPITFTWATPEGAAVFLISFYEKPDETPIYSALTKEPAYTLPEGVIKLNFKPGHQYFWRVAAFNAENNQTGESEKRTFILR